MELFKVQRYERAFGKGTFPRFREMPPVECSEVRGTIAKAIGVPAESDPLQILKSLAASSRCIPGINATDSGFRLDEVLEVLGVECSGRAILNWHRFDKMDEMATSDLCHWFGDIWYPSSDDLEVIDGAFRWIIIVEHHGAVSVLKM